MVAVYRVASNGTLHAEGLDDGLPAFHPMSKRGIDLGRLVGRRGWIGLIGLTMRDVSLSTWAECGCLMKTIRKGRMPARKGRA